MYRYIAITDTPERQNRTKESINTSESTSPQVLETSSGGEEKQNRVAKGRRAEKKKIPKELESEHQKHGVPHSTCADA